MFAYIIKEFHIILVLWFKICMKHKRISVCLKSGKSYIWETLSIQFTQCSGNILGPVAMTGNKFSLLKPLSQNLGTKIHLSI